ARVAVENLRALCHRLPLVERCETVLVRLSDFFKGFRGELRALWPKRFTNGAPERVVRERNGWDVEVFPAFLFEFADQVFGTPSSMNHHHRCVAFEPRLG